MKDSCWLNQETLDVWKNSCVKPKESQCQYVCPQGPKGKPGVSTVGAYISDGSLYIQLSSGETINAGKCVGDKGDVGERGVSITSTVIRDGMLYIYFSDGTEHNAGYCVPPTPPNEVNLDVNFSQGTNIVAASMSRHVLKPSTGKAVINFMILPSVINVPTTFQFEWSRRPEETPGEPNYDMYSGDVAWVKCVYESNRRFSVSFTPTSLVYHRLCFRCC
jgi:hypothetical protein